MSPIFALATYLETEVTDFNQDSAANCVLGKAKKLGLTISRYPSNPDHTGDCSCPNCVDFKATARAWGVPTKTVRRIYTRKGRSAAFMANVLREAVTA